MRDRKNNEISFYLQANINILDLLKLPIPGCSSQNLTLQNNVSLHLTQYPPSTAIMIYGIRETNLLAYSSGVQESKMSF